MATNQDKVKELIDLRNQAKLGGGEKRIESQHKKGKYTALGKNRHVAGRRQLRRIRYVRHTPV